MGNFFLFAWKAEKKWAWELPGAMNKVVRKKLVGKNEVDRQREEKRRNRELG